jgi:hypothetical protein
MDNPISTAPKTAVTSTAIATGSNSLQPQIAPPEQMPAGDDYTVYGVQNIDLDGR